MNISAHILFLKGQRKIRSSDLENSDSLGEDKPAYGLRKGKPRCFSKWSKKNDKAAKEIDDPSYFLFTLVANGIRSLLSSSPLL